MAHLVRVAASTSHDLKPGACRLSPKLRMCSEAGIQWCRHTWVLSLSLPAHLCLSLSVSPPPSHKQIEKIKMDFAFVTCPTYRNVFELCLPRSVFIFSCVPQPVMELQAPVNSSEPLACVCYFAQHCCLAVESAGVGR